MTCPERARLLIDYRDAVHRYSERVHDLVQTIGLEVNADTELLRRKVREAWDASEQARVALARHEGSHFCDRPGFEPASAT
jgi:RNase P subunit RPR2